jgi:hypothetical protein
MQKEKEETNIFNDLKYLVKKFISAKIELLKLESIDISTRFLSSLIFYFFICLIILLITLMISVLGGLYFSKLFNSNVYGFGLVCLIYIIFLIIILFQRKNIIEKVIAPKFLEIIFYEDEKN